LLKPVLTRAGRVVELGCGSGLLTRHLVAAGHRVVATDASPAMLELARETAAGAEEIRLLTLPDDPIPPADAIVSVGHVLNYLPDEAAIDRALRAVARALRAGGILALDICDLEYGKRTETSVGRATDDWALVTQFSLPAPNRFVRDIATFVRNPDGTWRRDDERHVNVLIDTSQLPGALAAEGVAARVGRSFGASLSARSSGSGELPAGLYAVTGTKEYARDA
jgi:SAM-dependent methyltransferase